MSKDKERNQVEEFNPGDAMSPAVLKTTVLLTRYSLGLMSKMCFSVKQKKLEMQLPINDSILLSMCCGSQMDNHSAGFCLAKGFFLVSIFRHFCVFATQKSAAHATALPAARTNAAAHRTAEPQPRMELKLSFTAGAERLGSGTSGGNLVILSHVT